MQGGTTIARKPVMAQPTRDTGLRINEQITNPVIRLINETGENEGLVDSDDARRRAEEVNLDLVEIQPKSDPPVCKIMDYGKYKYERQKRASEAKKKQRVIVVKEVKLRPNIDDHDYDVKLRSIRKFIKDGDRVKVTMRFRGRELHHQQLGAGLLHRVSGDVDDIARVEAIPEMEGRQMVMVVAPVR